MADIKYKASGRGTNPADLLTTELNSLANNAASAASAAISNDGSSELDMWADFELLAEFAASPTENTTVDLYIVRSLDGTNYEDVLGTEGRPKNGYAGSFVVNNNADPQRMILPMVPLPPLDFKVMVVNNATGQTLESSGNVLRAFFYKLQSA